MAATLEGLGSTRYYIAAAAKRGEATTYEIKTAQVIGETPRKWILRETDQIEDEERRRSESGDVYVAAPGKGWNDWSVPKKGEARREGKSEGRRNKYTQVFAQDRWVAEAIIREREAAAWASTNAYKIAQRLQYTIAKENPALLRTVAEMIGYKEEGT